MEKIIFGNLAQQNIEVVQRDNRYFVHYDAGAHQIVWREDEITPKELAQIESGEPAATQTLLAVQRRLELAGVDPYKSNWSPQQ